LYSNVHSERGKKPGKTAKFHFWKDMIAIQNRIELILTDEFHLTDHVFNVSLIANRSTDLDILGSAIAFTL